VLGLVLQDFRSQCVYMTAIIWDLGKWNMWQFFSFFFAQVEFCI